MKAGSSIADDLYIKSLRGLFSLHRVAMDSIALSLTFVQELRFRMESAKTKTDRRTIY